MLDDVDPLLHKYVEAPLAVRVVDAPAQIELTEALMFTEGAAVTVTATLALLEHPVRVVPVHVYVVVDAGLTVILDDVAPLLQR